MQNPEHLYGSVRCSKTRLRFWWTGLDRGKRPRRAIILRYFDRQLEFDVLMCVLLFARQVIFYTIGFLNLVSVVGLYFAKADPRCVLLKSCM